MTERQIDARYRRAARRPCPHCHGMGYEEWIVCGVCGGDGVHRSERRRRRMAWLARKPKCKCGRVGVQSVGLLGNDQPTAWLCRGHRWN